MPQVEDELNINTKPEMINGNSDRQSEDSDGSSHPANSSDVSLKQEISDTQVNDNFIMSDDEQQHDVARQFVEVEIKFPEDPPQQAPEEISNHETQDPKTPTQPQFQCEVCQRCFKRKVLLKLHFKNHTGDKPHVCQYCNRGFVQKGNLQTHLLTHTGETPYVCSLCPCRFSIKCNLQRHMKSHTGERKYVCNICNHRFVQNENLQSHIRTHTGEKPFQCTYCEKRFNHLNVLKRHVRTHTGERPYQCETCSRCFIQQSHLLRHCRTTHEKKDVGSKTSKVKRESSVQSSVAK